LSLNPPATVAKRIRRRGERGISRKTIARGMPGDFRCDRGDYARVPLNIRTRGCGRIGRPAFPAPSVVRGANDFCKPRAISAARMQNCVGQPSLRGAERVGVGARYNSIHVVPDKRVQRARSGTHNHQCPCCVKLGPQFCLQQASVVMGPRFRGDDTERLAHSRRSVGCLTIQSALDARGKRHPCTMSFAIMQWMPLEPLTVWVTRRSAARLQSV
jgi:hypothetical protein